MIDSRWLETYPRLCVVHALRIYALKHVKFVLALLQGVIFGKFQLEVGTTVGSGQNVRVRE